MASILTCLKKSGYSLASLSLFLLPAGFLSGQAITEPTVWDAAGGPYEVAALSIEAGASLRMEAGVEVRVAAGGIIVVRDGGELIAAGGEGVPVVVTSALADPAPGSWQSLVVAAGGRAVLDHAVIEYGGSQAGQGGLVAVYSSDVTLSNCTLRHSQHDGLAIHRSGLDGVSVEPSLDGVEIHDCDRHGIHMMLQQPHGSAAHFANLDIHGCGGSAILLEEMMDAPRIDGARALGNGYDGINVKGMGWPTARDHHLTDALDWKLERLQIGTGSTVTVGPGARLLFTKSINESIVHNGGTLLVEGGAGNPALFSSAEAEPHPGDWRGIALRTGSRAEIRHAILEYGGADTALPTLGLMQTRSGEVLLEDTIIRNGSSAGFVVMPSETYGPSVEPTLRRVEIHDCPGGGVTLQAQQPNGAKPRLEEVSIRDCAGAALTLYGYDEIPLMGGMSLSGNGFDGVDLPQANPATRDFTLGGEVPWRVGSMVLTAGVTGRIAAGTNVSFRKGAFLSVPAGAGFLVEGTAAKPATLISAEGNPSPGDWGLTAAEGAVVRISHCLMRHGSQINIHTPDFELRDVTLEEYGGPAAIFHSPSISAPYGRPLFRNLTIRNSVGMAINLPTHPTLVPIMDGLVLEGNPADVVTLGASTTDPGIGRTPVLLSNPGYPYRAQALQISSGEVIVPPGTVFEMGGTISITGGKLIAEGTEGAPVVFRESPGSTAPWALMSITNGGGADLRHCTFGPWPGTELLSLQGSPWGDDATYIHATDCSFSGAAAGNGININGNGRFLRCDFSNNAKNGIYCNSSYANMRAIFEDCRMTGNGEHGAYIFGPQRLLNCDILDNGRDGIYSLLYDDIPADRLPAFEGCRIAGNAGYGISNPATYRQGRLPARGLWWGDATGPHHPALNPDGLGDAVSDHVIFIPWATTPEGGVQSTSAIALGQRVSGETDATARHALTLGRGEAANVLIRLTPTSAGGTWRLLERDGQPPTFALFDREGTPRGDSLEILIPAPPPGVYHLAVTHAAVDGAMGSYELECIAVDRYLFRALLASAGNGGSATQELLGCGFVSGMTMELRSGEGVLRSHAPTLVLPSRAVIPMDLTGLPPGPVDIALLWPGGHTEVLPSAMEILPGTGARPWADLSGSGSSQFRRGINQAHYVRFGNRGDADALPRILTVIPSGGILLTPSLDDDPAAGQIQVLTIGPDHDVSVLPPGYTRQAGFYFRSDNDFLLSLESKEMDDTPMDWEAEKETLRPDAIDGQTWDANWPLIRERLGATTGEHAAMLLSNAQRLANRGPASPSPAWSVSHLINLEVRLATSTPAASISGRLLLQPYGRPQPSAVVKLYDALNEEAPPLFARSDSGGNFCFEELPDSLYRLVVDTYFLTEPVEVAVSNQADLAGLELAIYDSDPRPPGPPNRLPGRAPTLTAGPGGTAFLAWENGGQLHSLAWENNGWRSPAPIAAARGSNPSLIYDGNLLGPGQPGLLAAWETIDENEVSILAWSAGRWVDSAFEWSVPTALTSDVNHDSDPVIARMSDGRWVIVWLQRNSSPGFDDTDLYMTFVDPAAAKDWFVPAPSAMMGKDVCDSFNFATTISIPASLQEVFGTRYKAAAGFELCDGPLTCSSFEKSGAAKLVVELGDSLAVNGSGTMKSLYRLACKPCRYVPQSMTMIPSIAVEANFARPIPIIIGGVPVGTAKVSLPVAVGLRGRFGWYHQFTGLPDTGLLLLDCTAGGRVLVEDALGLSQGQGDLNLAGTYSWNPTQGFQTDGVCITLAGEAAILGGFAKRTFSKQWGDSCKASLVDFGEKSWATHDAIHYQSKSLRDGIPVTEIMSILVEPAIGTGGVYEGTPILATVASDLHDDGRPAIAADPATGALTMAWTKDLGDFQDGLGNQVVYTINDGAGWTPPLPIQAARHFNGNPSLARAADGTLAAAWRQASAEGLDNTSSLLDVHDAAEVAHIVVSRFVDGAWTIPAPITASAGNHEHPTLVPIGNRLGCVWVLHGEGGSTVLSSTSDGAGWTPPAVVATAPRYETPRAVPLGNSALLVWVEREDANELKLATGDARSPVNRLVYALATGSTWTAPSPIPASLTAELHGGSDPEPLKRADLVQLARAIPRPPSECCGETCKPTYRKPRPPIPPDPRTREDEQGFSFIRPIDPNEKHGPDGWGASNIVPSGTEFVYTILFENQPTATAPAQDVLVVDDLSDSLDWATFEIRSVGWGDQVIAFPSAPHAVEEYITIADYREALAGQWLLRINAQVEATTGRATFTFRTLDIETEEPPLDPLAGFLPPNDSTGRGEGFIVFAVKPRPGLPEDASVLITNRASIIFDLEDPIITNTVTNSIGDIPALRRSLIDHLRGAPAEMPPPDVNADGVIDAADISTE